MKFKEYICLFYRGLRDTEKNSHKEDKDFYHGDVYNIEFLSLMIRTIWTLLSLGFKF